MPGTKYVLTKLARNDIAKIRRYTLDTWGEAQWLKYQAALVEKLQTLADNPELGIKLEEIFDQAYRFPLKDYVIYYLKRQNDVVFVGVLSNKLAPAKHQTRKKTLVQK